MQATDELDRRGRYYCGHCREKISKTLYFSHKQLYYDVVQQKWRNEADQNQSSHTEQLPDQDFTFSDSEETADGTLLFSNGILTNMLLLY